MVVRDRSSSKQPLRAAIILSHTLLREGVSRLLNEEGFRVDGHFGSVDDAVTTLSDTHPDLVILGWDSPSISTNSVRKLVQSIPDAAVIVLAGIQMPYDENVMREMIEVGASGCLSADLSAPEFLQSLRLLARGDLVVSREVAWPLHEANPDSDPEPLPSDLTQRERQVLQFVAQGDTNKEIAQALVVTESTVKTHLNNILSKLDLRNRQQAAAYAIRYALVSAQPKK